MKFKEIEIGSFVRFGTDPHRPAYGGGLLPMHWRKVSNDGLMIADQNADPYVNSVDYPRPISGRTVREREAGTAFFPESALFQYLNSEHGVFVDGVEWFTPRDHDECAPTWNHQTGFLSRFDSDELKLLRPWTMKIQTPQRLTRRYGKVYEKECLVGLPSISEFLVYTDHEGYRERYESERVSEQTPIPNYHRGIATRSCIGESVFAITANNSVGARSPSGGMSIYPMVRIDPDVDVTLFDRVGFPYIKRYDVVVPSQSHEAFMLALEAMLDM